MDVVSSKVVNTTSTNTTADASNTTSNSLEECSSKRNC